ncbi:MAG: ABC transporter [Firmicutes bacterium HGW-Firmicutes-15]|nr:MAG: ABC transporter [Firmicutes bacterium HGW-Firmicutes-15]
MDKVLEVKGITKLYKNNRGVKDISFDIYKGDIYGFLGPNGAGKTTVMKTIVGLCRANQGEINIFGYNIANQFEQAMAKVGCIIETADSYEYLSAYDNLKIASRFYDGIDSNRIDEVLEIVGLSPYKKEKTNGFSLGMKQRLGVAGAILSRPQFLILDEPTNGLDIEGMADIRNMIISLAREQQITFFVSSHLAHEMQLMCNRVGILNNGLLIKEGLITDILEKHTSLEEFFIEQAKNSRGD